MANQKFIFLRSRSANGSVPNTDTPPIGMIAPKNKFLTKKYNEGDTIDGVLSNGTVSIVVTDAVTNQNEPHKGTVTLTTPMYSTRSGVKTYWMKEMGSTDNTDDATIQAPISNIPQIVIVILAVCLILAVLWFSKG